MSESVSREKLVQQYEYVTKMSLVQVMSDAHIRVLREDIEEWQELMTELGLDHSQLKLIDLQENRKVMKRHAALQKWKKLHGKRATYLAFLTACMRVKNIPLAEKMLDLLNTHLKEEQTKTEKMASSPLRRSYHEDELDLSLSLSLSHTSISSLGSLGERLPFKERLEELQMRHRNTLDIISQYFNKNIKPEAIHKTLALMPPELKCLKSYEQLVKSDSMNVFAEIVDETDYRHNEILQKLVSDLGDSHCKSAMMSYLEDLQTFNAETYFRKLPNGWTGTSLGNTNIDITLYLGHKWERRTLQDFEEFMKGMELKAGFNAHQQLRIGKIEHVCLRLTLMVASDSTDISNLKKVAPDYFKTNNILQVSVDNNIIYHVESPKHYEFVNHIPSHFICPIIRQIMQHPYKTTCCGKHISKEAAMQCQHHDQPCPLCHNQIVEPKLDQVLQDKTRCAKIFCPYKHEGCHWEGEIRFLLKHLRGSECSCKYALTHCPYSCGSYTQKISLDKHLTTCPMYNTPLVCQYCSLTYARNQPHLEECPLAPVQCPYQCGEVMNREDIPAHLKVCKKLKPKPRKPRPQEESHSVEHITHLSPVREKPKQRDHATSPSREKPKQKDYATSPSREKPKLRDHATSPTKEKPKQKDYATSPSREKPKLRDHATSPTKEKPKQKDHATSPPKLRDHATSPSREKPKQTDHATSPSREKPKLRDHATSTTSEKLKQQDKKDDHVISTRREMSPKKQREKDHTYPFTTPEREKIPRQQEGHTFTRTSTPREEKPEKQISTKEMHPKRKEDYTRTMISSQTETEPYQQDEETDSRKDLDEKLPETLTLTSSTRKRLTDGDVDTLSSSTKQKLSDNSTDTQPYSAKTSDSDILTGFAMKRLMDSGIDSSAKERLMNSGIDTHPSSASAKVSLMDSGTDTLTSLTKERFMESGTYTPTSSAKLKLNDSIDTLTSSSKMSSSGTDTPTSLAKANLTDTHTSSAGTDTFTRARVTGSSADTLTNSQKRLSDSGTANALTSFAKERLSDSGTDTLANLAKKKLTDSFAKEKVTGSRNDIPTSFAREMVTSADALTSFPREQVPNRGTDALTSFPMERATDNNALTSFPTEQVTDSHGSADAVTSFTRKRVADSDTDTLTSFPRERVTDSGTADALTSFHREMVTDSGTANALTSFPRERVTDSGSADALISFPRERVTDSGTDTLTSSAKERLTDSTDLLTSSTKAKLMDSGTYTRLSSTRDTTDEGADHSYKLISIARKMLHLRCQLPDTWAQYLQLKIRLNKVKMARDSRRSSGLWSEDTAMTGDTNTFTHPLGNEEEDIMILEHQAAEVQKSGNTIEQELHKLRSELLGVYREREYISI